MADPSPVLSRILANQAGFDHTLNTNFQTIGSALESPLSQGLPQALQAAISSIESGDISDAVNNLNTAILLGLLPTASPPQNILQILGEMAQNLTNAIDTLPNVGLQILLAPVGVLFGTSQAFADSAQAVVEAFNAGQTMTALTDLINMPATVTGTFLTGYSADFVNYLGILSSAASPSGGGPLDALSVQIPQEIAQALGASTSTSAAAMLADLGNLLDPSSIGDIGSNLSTMFGDLLTSI